MELDLLVAAIDGLVAAGPAVFADGESVELLHRQLSRLEAVVTAATGAFDSARGFEASSFRSLRLFHIDAKSPVQDLISQRPCRVLAGNFQVSFAQYVARAAIIVKPLCGSAIRRKWPNSFPRNDSLPA